MNPQMHLLPACALVAQVIIAYVWLVPHGGHGDHFAALARTDAA